MDLVAGVVGAVEVRGLHGDRNNYYYYIVIIIIIVMLNSNNDNNDNNDSNSARLHSDRHGVRRGRHL